MAPGSKLGTAYVDVHGDFSPLERDLAAKLPALGKQIEGTFNEDHVRDFNTEVGNTSKVVGDADRKFFSLDRSITRTNSRFSLLRNTITTLRLPVLAGGLSAAAEGTIALAGGIVSLTSALAPLSGALVGYPALFGAIGQAAGVVALSGVNDLTDALAGNEEALKRLNPEGRQFLEQLKEMEPRYRRLQSTAQGPLFAGIDSGLSSAVKNFPSLNKVVGDTADEMGDLADQTGHFLGREGFGRDFEFIGGRNAELIGDMGDAGLHFADALRHVLVAADPFIDWMSDSLVTWSRYVEESAEAGRKTGDLAGFFDESQEAIERVVDISGSLFNILGDIGRASDHAGEGLLDSLAGSLDSLERITGSVEGQHAMRDFFEGSADDIRAMGRALEDILDEGSFPDMVAKAIELAVPVIAEHAGEMGIAVAEGLYHGFTESGILGKLFTAAAFIRLIGGRGAVGAVGVGLAKVIAKAMLPGLATTIAAEGGLAAALGSGAGLAAIGGAMAPLVGAGLVAGLGTYLGIKFTQTEAFKNLENTLTNDVDGTKMVENTRIVNRLLGKTELIAKQSAAGLDITTDAFEASSQAADYFSDEIKEATKRFAAFEKQVKKSADDVGGAVTDMAATATEGLGILGDNADEMLSELGVKKTGFSLKKVGKTLHFQRGGLIPGHGDGDKVPVLAEPGEGFINKTAVKALGGEKAINAINKTFPRFQGGGVVGGMSAMMALASKYESQHYPYLWGGGHGGFPNGSSPVDCSGFVSDVLHAGGLLQGAPMVSGSLANWGKPARGNEPLVVYANTDHTLLSLNGKFAGTSTTNPGGGAGWIEDAPSAAYLAGFAARTMPVSGALASKLKRILMRGPAGPLRSMGQGALDKTRKAANQYISSKFPSGTLGGGQSLADFAKGPGKVVGATTYGFGEPGTGTVGASGMSLPGHRVFAELDMGTALGGLPFGTALKITVGHKSTVATKEDIGLGGPDIEGYPRAIDLWQDTANALGIGVWSGLAKVHGLQKGGMVPSFHQGGIFRAPPGQTEGLALLRDREEVRTVAQQGGPNVEVVIHGTVLSDRHIDDAIEVKLDGRSDFNRQIRRQHR